MTTKFENRRRALCADTAARFGHRKAFAFELARLERKGLEGERAFRLAALNVFGRAL